jgi:hypothetical protein
MKNDKFGISFILGIVLTVIISVNTNLFRTMESGLSLIVVIIMIFGLSVLINFILEGLSSEVKNTKGKVNKIIEEKKLNIEIKNNLKQQDKDYSEIKSSHHYFSNEKLLEIFQNGIYKDAPFKQLALEEILFERNLISHSKTHEKMHNMKEYFLNNND